ncbi:hypothetical protein [Neotabrizicola sp. sgz301269]|uniref:hypothetical protein n=1 Tax=Neotabrizicola sp. sgz301269 TaxID=3276282 RepID=UPI00376FF30E
MTTPEELDALAEAHMYQSGETVWHSSGDDAGPDVGISVGLGDAALFAGELPEPDGSIGWGLAIYPQDGERITIARSVDAFKAREMIEAIAAAMRARGAALEAENFSLASWQCEFTDGKTGLVYHDGGGTYCQMQRRAEAAEAELARRGQGVQVNLVWEDLDGYAWRATAPLFGSFRVERYGNGPWQALWSVPGYCATFVDGGFATAEDAKQAIEARIRAALVSPGDGWGGRGTYRIEEWKVWKGVDPINPRWGDCGFACSTYEDAVGLMDYVVQSFPGRIRRIVFDRSPPTSEGT